MLNVIKTTNNKAPNWVEILTRDLFFNHEVLASSTIGSTFEDGWWSQGAAVARAPQEAYESCTDDNHASDSLFFCLQLGMLPLPATVAKKRFIEIPY